MMRAKPTNPEHAAGLIDPQTKRSPFIDPETEAVIEADVPDNTFWTRRLMAREITLVADAPTGAEPIAALTTRGGK